MIASSAALLAVLRADWRFRKGWESLAEVRMLDFPDVSQRRCGALTAIYRYIGENMKVGAGYNFTGSIPCHPRRAPAVQGQ